MEIWTFDKAAKQILGESAETLWQHYQQDVDLYPWDNYKPETCAAFSFQEKLLFAGESLNFKNHSRLADNLIWTINGKEVSADKSGDMTWVFPEKGTYKIQLCAENSASQKSDTLSKTVEVMGVNDIFEFSLLGGKTSCQHNDSPKGENVEMLFDGKKGNKFLSFQKETWVQLETKVPFVLKSYSITSGNDPTQARPQKLDSFSFA